MLNTSTDTSVQDEIHRIEPEYVTSQLIGALFACFFIDLSIYGIGWLIIGISTDEGNPIDRAKMWPFLAYIMIGLTIFIVGLTYIFAKLYVQTFSYDLSEKFIIIRYGVLTKTKTTIPYSRIQNIAVYQNIRDRILHVFSVRIETAGASIAAGNSQQGGIRPEGFIPAVRDPTRLEQIINKLVHQYTQTATGDVRDKVFMDTNVVFDEFIAYFLSKMREKDQLHTNVQILREHAKLSQVQLADRLNISESTIKYLEAGEFVPSLTLALQLAKTLNVSIEEIFALTH